jgi:hypothetical protein
MDRSNKNLNKLGLNKNQIRYEPRTLVGHTISVTDDCFIHLGSWTEGVSDRADMASLCFAIKAIMQSD